MCVCVLGGGGGGGGGGAPGIKRIYIGKFSLGRHKGLDILTNISLESDSCVWQISNRHYDIIRACESIC